MLRLMVAIGGVIWIAAAGLLLWAHAQHMVAFEVPAARKSASIDWLSPTKEKPLGALHFLAASCSCSQHIAQHLIERGPAERVLEQVVLIGVGLDHQAAALEAQGFALSRRSIEQVQSEGLSAAPAMVVYDAAKVVHYAGGYTSGSITPLSHYKDLEIFSDLLAQKRRQALPVRGCAVARNLQALLDPLGLKYAQP